MNLVDNWRLIMAKAWSIRLILLAGICSLADTWVPMLIEIAPALQTFMSPLAFTRLSAVLSVAAVIARVLPQKSTAPPTICEKP